MKRVISLFFLSVYLAFVAGSLVASTEQRSLASHNSEFKAKPAEAKKIQKYLPLNGKIKLTRPDTSSAFFDQSSFYSAFALRSTLTVLEAPKSSSALYLKNRILLI